MIVYMVKHKRNRWTAGSDLCPKSQILVYTATSRGDEKTVWTMDEHCFFTFSHEVRGVVSNTQQWHLNFELNLSFYFLSSNSLHCNNNFQILLK
jgi:hypothetical protein